MEWVKSLINLIWSEPPPPPHPKTSKKRNKSIQVEEKGQLPDEKIPVHIKLEDLPEFIKLQIVKDDSLFKDFWGKLILGQSKENESENLSLLEDSRTLHQIYEIDLPLARKEKKEKKEYILKTQKQHEKLETKIKELERNVKRIYKLYNLSGINIERELELFNSQFKPKLILKITKSLKSDDFKSFFEFYEKFLKFLNPDLELKEEKFYFSKTTFPNLFNFFISEESFIKQLETSIFFLNQEKNENVKLKIKKEIKEEKEKKIKDEKENNKVEDEFGEIDWEMEEIDWEVDEINFDKQEKKTENFEIKIEETSNSLPNFNLKEILLELKEMNEFIQQRIEQEQKDDQFNLFLFLPFISLTILKNLRNEILNLLNEKVTPISPFVIFSEITQNEHLIEVHKKQIQELWVNEKKYNFPLPEELVRKGQILKKQIEEKISKKINKEFVFINT